MKSFVSKIIGRFETRLPRGLPEFHSWAKSIIDTYELPDNDSTKWTLACMVLEMHKNCDAIPKRQVAKLVYKAMANQVVSRVMHDLKEKQKAEQDAAAAEALVKKTEEVASGSQE